MSWKGLNDGIELVKDLKTKEPFRESIFKVCWRTRGKKLNINIINHYGTYDNVLRIALLTISGEELD